MIEYIGKPGGIVERFDAGGRLKPLNPRLDLRNHSPTGFAWGYGGSGPAQLALAILADLLGDGIALTCYQLFKFDVIANLDREWHLTETEIRQWHRAHLAERTVMMDAGEPAQRDVSRDAQGNMNQPRSNDG